jgi:hypothetical protein
MAQHERGLYEPGDEVRVYDGADDEEDVEGSRLPLLIVLALLVLAMFAGFVWLAYSEGVARGRGEAPVITADAGPARVAPANPGGAAEPYKGFKVYEQPAPPDDDAASNTAQSAPAPARPPAASPTKPAPAVTAQAGPPKPAPSAPAPSAQVPSAAAVAPTPAPTKMANATPPAKPAPAKAASLPAQPIGPATAPPRSLNATATPPAAAPAKPALAPSVPAATQPAASGTVVLQIGAYKSQADANTAWTIYKSKHSALLAGYAPDVQQADLGEKGTWYRLRIGGFPSRDVATGLCDRLKADGGNCFLGK